MEAIFKAWEDERKSPQLTGLPADIEQIYKSERKKLKEQVTAAAGSIERRMAEIALQRLDFCLQDLFHLRKEKLHLAAARGDEVDMDCLLPWEQQYYAEIKRVDYFYKQNVSTPDSVLPSQQPLIPTAGITSIPPPKPATIPVPPPGVTEQDRGNASAGNQVLDGQGAGTYVTIRFLQPEGAIIGVDMREYGPFEAGEIVYLPDVHARIFITNGVAKQVFPSA